MACNKYNKVLDDTDLHSYYIACKVQSDNEVIPIVLENAEFVILIEKSQQSYQKRVVRKALKSNNPLRIEENLYTSLKKYEVRNIPEIETIMNEGVEKLKSRYFEENVQKVDLSDEEKRYLIYLLFQSGIFVKDDDETGYLVIH